MNNKDTQKKDSKNKKNKRPKERMTSFKELSFTEKIGYIWGYYKYYMLAFVIAAIFIGSFINSYMRNNYDEVCSVYVIDGKITGYDDESDKITTGFTEHLGIDGKKTRVSFNYNHSLINRSEYDQELSVTMDKIVILSYTGSLDGYMAEIDYIDFFCTDEEPFMYNLTEILTPDELNKIGENNIVYYTKEDGSKFPIAVNLTNTKIKTETDLTMKTPCYGVVITAPNKENAIEFIRYAFDL